MQEELKSIAEKARLEINQAESAEELKAVQVRYLGKKGRITAVLRSMGSLPAAERPVVGKLANQIRDDLIAEIAKREDQLRDLARSRQVAAERLDVTMPGIPQPLGHLHPLTLVMDEIAEIFLGMGFNIAEGPEVETDYYNFEALNIPKDHPARDMQDSFYFGSDILLRTHTSPVQVHTMVKTAPNVPVRIIAPGKVYRRDDDATHSPMFHQVEGLAIDRNISLSDLKGTLLLFVRQMFGAHQQVRLRPSFFPFTEPSAEVDMSCVICAGKGCRVCKETGWLEILGAGMVHPRVLEMSGYDPEEYTGYAFGMGVERIAMLKYGIDDLRLFFKNDLRMLRQFY
ncbi:MAG: phenylalanine--tRNA ligase subunit alpha [Bacillota bacterium]|jgi:phenylalanyl-tRNA synthetase alpha chain|nr:phenylalanine--tRNA ligase subunit alpha [Bacillota bacterium]HHU30230.1 phenylalanine--tRNA ligase subunit alpha [Bacillota bacterium]